MSILYFAVGLGVFLLSFVLFKPSLLLARAVGAIDIPKGRKMHSRPTARVGGFAFFVAFILFLPLLPIRAEIKVELLLGGGIMFLVGFFDDALQLSPFVKLCGQLLAATVYLLSADFHMHAIYSIILLFWIVFITNAINLIDGLDGLAGGVSCSIALALSVISMIFGSYDITLASLLLLFAILGFLPRNIPPARIFMGDCGALTLGFLLASLSARLIFESRSLLCWISVVLQFRLPSTDTVQCFIRRLISGKSPFAADRGHFHHKLLQHGFTPECASLLLITASLLLGLLSIAIASLSLI